MTVALHLARARLSSRTGNAWLDVLAITAFTLSTWLALTVAGGTYMFHRRRLNPPEGYRELFAAGPDLSPEVVGGAGDLLDYMLNRYFALAVIACILLVIPIFSLGAGAARLGARGRSRRLATLRLLGMTSGEVTRIALIESVVQTVVGLVAGTALWLISLPAWHRVSFQATPIHPGEMLLGPKLLAGVLGAVFLISALSTIAGLARVRISPLGVARRSGTHPVHWAAVAFLAVNLLLFLYVQRDLTGRRLGDLSYLIAPLIIVAGTLLGIYLAGPYLLQALARPLLWGAGPARMIGARRIIDDPRRAWRGIAGLVFLIFVTTVVTSLDRIASGSPDETLMVIDTRTGVIITVAIGFIVAACSTVMTQSAEIVDRAGELRALDAAGFPRATLRKVRMHQALIPLVISALLAIALAFLILVPVMREEDVSLASLRWVAVIVALGFTLIVLAVNASTPLERRVLDAHHRRND
ncbi:MAG: hypothetical protein Q4P33_04030 [Flaviflexus sp.]|nr:hypothetical protein [Flaviflexus sp.]